MKVVVIKKVNTPKETNPVTVPMEGVEAIIAEKEAAEQQVLELQKALQEAHVKIEHLEDQVDTLQNSLAFVNEERRKMLDKLTSNASTENCPDCTCKGMCSHKTDPSVRRVFVIYI